MGTRGERDKKQEEGMGVAVIEARGKKCFKEGVVEDLSDLPTRPWLCMVMEPPRKKPRINEVAPWSSSINSSTGRKPEHVSLLLICTDQGESTWTRWKGNIHRLEAGP